MPNMYIMCIYCKNKMKKKILDGLLTCSENKFEEVERYSNAAFKRMLDLFFQFSFKLVDVSCWTLQHSSRHFSVKFG